MSKIINCVIDTYSRKERKELIEYVSSKIPFVSLTSKEEGFRLFCISGNSGGYVGVIVARHLVENEKYKHFYSINQFKMFLDSRGL